MIMTVCEFCVASPRSKFRSSGGRRVGSIHLCVQLYPSSSVNRRHEHYRPALIDTNNSLLVGSDLLSTDQTIHTNIRFIQLYHALYFINFCFYPPRKHYSQSSTCSSPCTSRQAELTTHINCDLAS